tara:strand:+ start:284 stop:496 length:213 start_codon:yes stop_codon:yes gene_type:complete
MKAIHSYGNMVFESGEITKKTTYYFDSLTELLDFRDTMSETHTVHLNNLRIEITRYVEFERSMVEGGEEE